MLDLINMHRSHCYNPFVYLRNDNDVQRLVTNLFKATTPKGSQSQDPFWDTAASMLLLALVFYLKYEAPPDEQNFPMVMELLRAGEVREDDDSYVSPLDELFDRLEMVNPEHIALKYYRDYHSGSAKTLKSIQITLAARLEKFNLESLAGLTATDELDLPSLGEKKVALFALIPDNDTSFNFLVSILYTQLFQQLFYLADHKYGGSLPVHCHFIMDEFGEPSMFVIDERRGNVEVLKKQIERAVKQHDSKLIILDVLTDVIRSLPLDEQEMFMAFEKQMKKEGVVFINILHTRKPSSDKSGEDTFKRVNEYDILGSGTIPQSADINLVLNRNKMASDPIERNTTYVDLPKCRGGVTSTDVCKLYYDQVTRQQYDLDDWLAKQRTNF